MSKTVKFDVQGFDSRDIMDSMNNVKKVSDGLRRAYKAIDKVDAEKGDDALLLDYDAALRPVLITNVKEILNLDSKTAKKLEDASISDLENFYGQLSVGFIGLDYPTVQLMIKNMREQVGQPVPVENDDAGVKLVDPKSKEDK